MARAFPLLLLACAGGQATESDPKDHHDGASLGQDAHEVLPDGSADGTPPDGPEAVDSEVVKPPCNEGDTETCGSDIGECATGLRTCKGEAWGACEGETLPGAESCNGLDDDCDDATDEDGEVLCSPAQSSYCLGTSGCVVCDSGTSDCNDDEEDECECGPFSNAAPACESGCAMLCDEGWVDCDSTAGPSEPPTTDEDGCETNDPLSCSGLTADCDGNVCTGCETATASDVAHCGGCDPCPTPSNGTVDCVGGGCVVSCDEGFHLCGSSCCPDWVAISTVGAPDAYDQRAAWTGSELLLWGGNGVGGRYTPADDTWTAMAAGGPANGYTQLSVWTGTEMIVWGGYSIHEGSRYSPATDEWTPMSTIGAPYGGEGGIAVWTGSQMFTWSAFGGSSTGRYSPGTDTWTGITATGQPPTRVYHAAVWTGTAVVIWGGLSSSLSYDEVTGGRYFPGSNSWLDTNTTGAPEPRDMHTLVWSGSEVLAWGGGLVLGMSGVVNSGGRYDPGSDSWQPITDVGAPSPRYAHTAVWTGTEMIVWGGNDISADLGDGARYDPALDVWTPVTSVNAPAARYGHSAVWTGSEMILWRGSATPTSGAKYTPP